MTVLQRYVNMFYGCRFLIQSILIKNKKGVTFVTPFSIMNCINSYFPSPESLSLKAASPSISPKVVFSAEVDVI